MIDVGDMYRLPSERIDLIGRIDGASAGENCSALVDERILKTISSGTWMRQVLMNDELYKRLEDDSLIIQMMTIGWVLLPCCHRKD